MAESTLRVGSSLEHIGELIRAGKYGHRLIRDQYAIPSRTPSTRFPREMYSDELWAAQAWAFEDEAHTRFSDEYCTRQR
jgi:hypothetical protein